ncbi:hypothetical protein Amac_033920 [Acrocarpospora macrocephala]|uniref:Uncharacterized protein n=1 Tax=Acrocarpospora macrocephala TaxID=150177 RepID=A0A5M3WMD6_9ACTN|nr:hypothetical protein Amac_033920 [Acrocarpospora macrocephala]
MHARPGVHSGKRFDRFVEDGGPARFLRSAFLPPEAILELREAVLPPAMRDQLGRHR